MLCITEAHLLRKEIREELLQVLRDGDRRVTIGQGPASREHRISIPMFTCVLTTPEIELIHEPLRRCFPLQFVLSGYTADELRTVASMVAVKSNLILEEVRELAEGLYRRIDWRCFAAKLPSMASHVSISLYRHGG